MQYVSVLAPLVLLTFDLVSPLNPWNTDLELSPCQASIFVKEVSTGLSILTPTFNPDIFAVQLRTESFLTIKSTDPVLIRYLLSYYKLTSSVISAREVSNLRGKSAMVVTFNQNYLTFLDLYGIPLSCLGYYAGTTPWTGVTAIQQLAARLTRNFRPQTTGQSVKYHGHGIDSSDVVTRMNLDTVPFRPPSSVGVYPESPGCEPLFLRLQDGSLLTVLPALTLGPPVSIKIPGVRVIPATTTVNVTFLLSHYVSTGLTCLERNLLRANFSQTIYNWLETKLIPALLGESSCYQGFSAILTLTKALHMYADAMNVQGVALPTRQPQERQEPQPQFYREDWYDNQDVSQNRLSVLDTPEVVAPPPVYQNTYYVARPPEPPPPEWMSGEYAPLHGQEPEVIENEVYKSPRFNYQLEPEESTTPAQVSSVSVLSSGVPIVIFLIILCCLIALLCFYCLKPKAFKRNKNKAKAWCQNCCADDLASESPGDEEKEPLSRKRSRDKCKETKLNIKVNDRAVAEVSFHESCDDSEDLPPQPAPRRKKDGQRSESLTEGEFERSLPRKLREERERGRVEDSEGLRSKRHTLPVRSELMRPPPPKRYSYEKRKIPGMSAVKESPSYRGQQSSSDDLGRNRTEVSSQQEFYENRMRQW